jgi:hypothetical protein
MKPTFIYSEDNQELYQYYLVNNIYVLGTDTIY